MKTQYYAATSLDGFIATESIVGLRLEVAAGESGAKAPKAKLHGEARVIAGRTRADAERFARHAFSTMAGALREVGNTVALRPDSLTIDLARLSVEVGAGNDSRARGCATVRP